jgi:hypothetical protein
MLIFGHYKFFPKRTAYRADWCNACQNEGVSHQTRHLYVGHLFWIPLLPLGWYNTWRCADCQRNPRTRVTTSPVSYVGGIVSLILLASLFLSGELSLDPTKQWLLVAACGLGLTTMLVGLLIRLKNPPPDHPVSPLQNTSCLICHQPLPGGEKPQCFDCGAIRR